MGKMNFNSRVMGVFSEMGTSYDEIKNLMFDLYKGELRDGITKTEAEDKIREVSLKIFGLTKDSSKRDRKRAYAENGRQFFDVIEEVVDWTVSTGLIENGNIQVYDFSIKVKDGDENNPLTISISKIGGHIVNMNYNRQIDVETISYEEANNMGMEFLKHMY